MERINMGDNDVFSVLKETGAIKSGHFKLTSDRHSDTYIQCARVLEYPTLTLRLAKQAVDKLSKDLQVDMVASPAVGGILFGFAVAAAMDLPLIFSERVEGKMLFRRSFEVPSGARVLIVEDVVTTGGSVKEVCDLVEAAGGVVAGVLSLIDRGGVPQFSAPYYPLLKLETPSWDPDECELCRQGIAITSPGSRSLAK